jgi:HK97 family phage major capsid protein
MKKSIQLKEQRMKLVQDNRLLLNKADAEKRRMSSDEQTEYNNRDKEIESLDSEILMNEKQEAREAQAGQREPNRVPDAAAEGSEFSAAKKKAFHSYIKNGNFGPGATPQIVNALQADSDTAGGYIVPPQEFVQELIEVLDNEVFIRELSTVHTLVSAESLGMPARTADVDDSDWTTELATGSEDTGLVFEKRELKPWPVAKLIKVSNKLLQRSPMGPEAIIKQRLGYKFGVTLEKAFMTGTGAGRPLGVFTAATNGVSTGRDISTDNTTTTFTADGLINALYNLKGQYQNRATWIFHRDAIKMARKLKDGNGQYLWQPGLGGQPSTILDRPYKMSEYAPNTFTTGLYVGIVGDFKTGYHIVEALNMQLQRLVELYAAANQVGFIGRMEVDAMPVLEECFSRVKLA